MKSFLLLSLAIVLSYSVFSQDITVSSAQATATATTTPSAKKGHTVYFKPAIGINITDFSRNTAENKSTGRVGWQIGGSLAIGRKAYIEPGVFYLQKSTKLVSSDTATTGKVNLDVSGIRVPLAIGIVFGAPEDILKIRAFGGGSAFFITNVNEGVKDEFESPTWGLFAGAGLDFSMFFLEAKYEWSLTNVQKDITLVDVGKSRTIFINAGLKLKLGK